MSYERHFEVRYSRRDDPNNEFISKHDKERDAQMELEKLAAEHRIKTVEMVEVIQIKLGTAFKA